METSTPVKRKSEDEASEPFGANKKTNNSGNDFSSSEITADSTHIDYSPPKMRSCLKYQQIVILERKL